jgi:hypothetical protein
VPAGQERGQDAGRHWLDLAPQSGQRSPTQQAQYLDVAPLAADTGARPGGDADFDRGELTGGDAARGSQAFEGLLDHEHAEPEPGGAGRRGERPVGTGVPGH